MPAVFSLPSLKPRNVQLAVERFVYGVDTVKELLSTLTSDEHWGVMLKFDQVSPDKFAQLLVDAPQWSEWMA